MKINRTFLGQRLKEARKKKGLTQQQLGELTELSDKYISRIEQVRQICHWIVLLH